MRTQAVYYAVHDSKLDLDGCGYSDFARFIFHVGAKAFLFGKHKGKTLVVEFFTSGFFLRLRLLRTKGEKGGEEAIPEKGKA